MRIKSTPFSELPFSELYRAYTGQSEQIAPFFNYHPFREGDVQARAESSRFDGDREVTQKALETFNRSFGAPEQTFDQLNKLSDPESLAVVTGQQLILYGGPLFTVYKTLTAIIYARRWEALLKRPVIPVFWLADEDHDFLEATEVGIMSGDERVRVELDKRRSGAPVGREVFGDELATFEDQLFEALPDSDFTSQLRSLMASHYREGATFRESFGGLLLDLFGEQGLVLAGSEDPELKKLISDPMIEAARSPEALSDSLEKQSRKLESAGFGRQAIVSPSNLFVIDDKLGRVKLDYQEGAWSGVNGTVWKNEQLSKEIKKNPSRYSPNVFLRPIMQDRLLPTLAYVCGPGELAYYAQMKEAYRWAGQSMPLLLPRFSLTLLEPSIKRILEELPFKPTEFQNRLEDLESDYLEKSDTLDVEGMVSKWREEVDRLSEEMKSRLLDIDPTLGGSVERSRAIFQKEVDRLRSKSIRALKNRDHIQISRIHRVRHHLFPEGKLQERQIAFISYMNRYGLDLWDRLLVVLESEISDSHKFIEL